MSEPQTSCILQVPWKSYKASGTVFIENQSIHIGYASRVPRESLTLFAFLQVPESQRRQVTAGPVRPPDSTSSARRAPWEMWGSGVGADRSPPRESNFLHINAINTHLSHLLAWPQALPPLPHHKGRCKHPFTPQTAHERRPTRSQLCGTQAKKSE